MSERNKDKSISSRCESVRFLLVEDSKTDALIVQSYLRDGLDVSFQIDHVSTCAAATECLSRQRFDLVLLDLTLPDSSGLDTFHAAHAAAKGDAILILSGQEDGDLALEAVRAGAQDYVLKRELNAHTLTRQVGFALERNKRLRAERELAHAQEQILIAHKLQMGLYPDATPDLDGIDLAGRAWTSEFACGDYFDFVPMKNGATGVVVGDVSGHGLGPALKMVETRAALHAYTEYEENLCSLLSGVHRVFCGGQEPDRRGLVFVTLFLGRLGVADRTLEYCSAGHPGFHLTADGDWKMLAATDFPIGFSDDVSPQDVQSLSLDCGDVVVIPTDGFYEAGVCNRDTFGIDRLMGVVREHRAESATEILMAMYEAARDHVRGYPQEDDMAAIVIKVK